MITAVIIEDELNSRELLGTFLEKYCPQVSLKGMTDNIQGGIDLINKSQPDLIFLDIELAGGTGFQILDAFKPSDFLVCFVTGYSEYAIKAIKYGAFGYMLKPLNKDELIEVVQKAENQRTGQKKQASLLVEEGQKITSIDISKIEYLSVNGNYTMIHLIDGKKVISGENLSYYASLLPEHQFARIHKSNIVNIAQISEIEIKRSGVAHMKSGKSISIASRRKKEFLQKMKDYLENNDTLTTF